MRSLPIFILLFINFVPFASYAEWEEVSKGISGDVTYIDRQTLKIVGTSRFFYRLTDYVKPSKYGDLSAKVYLEVNCQNLNFRYLVANFYAEPLGRGSPTAGSGPTSDNTWIPAPPGSVSERVNRFVCGLDQ